MHSKTKFDQIRRQRKTNTNENLSRMFSNQLTQRKIVIKKKRKMLADGLDKVPVFISVNVFVGYPNASFYFNRNSLYQLIEIPFFFKSKFVTETVTSNLEKTNFKKKARRQKTKLENTQRKEEMCFVCVHVIVWSEFMAMIANVIWYLDFII